VASDTASVNVLVVLVEVGLKFALTPPGRPDTTKLTGPENPLWAATETVREPAEP
jgi:hypothetical protein